VGELKATSPGTGLLPVSIGTVALVETDAGVLTSVSPYGKASVVSTALKKAHGVGFPDPNRSEAKDGLRCIWFGRGEALLMGATPSKTLEKSAAVVDQSDAWTVVTLSGADAVDVLARLAPVDFRPQVFEEGQTVRTQVMHMSASITKVGPEAFLIMVFRSMAATLVHDLKRAMEAVASRR